jgi:hypothetical protein
MWFSFRHLCAGYGKYIAAHQILTGPLPGGGGFDLGSKDA